MEASYAKEYLKMLEEAAQGENSLLAGIAQESNLEAKITRYKDTLTRLQEDGYKPLGQYEKFSKAGMVEEYRSIYNVACSHSHNNIRSLIDRFFVIDEAQTDFDLALFRQYDCDELDHYLGSGILILRNGSRTIHSVLETGKKEKFSI